jgi:hypothetical protein
MAKLIRGALFAAAVQQAVKFSKTPRGQQLISQARAAATDPQQRALLIQQVKDRTQRGGTTPGQPGVADPYPPQTQPLAAPTAASPGPVPPPPPSSPPSSPPIGF